MLRTPLQLRTFISDSTELKHFLIINFELTLYLILLSGLPLLKLTRTSLSDHEAWQHVGAFHSWKRVPSQGWGLRYRTSNLLVLFLLIQRSHLFLFCLFFFWKTIALPISSTPLATCHLTDQEFCLTEKMERMCLSWLTKVSLSIKDKIGLEYA